MVVVVLGVGRVAFRSPFSATFCRWLVRVRGVTVPVNHVVESDAALLAPLRKRGKSALVAAAPLASVKLLVAEFKSAIEGLVSFGIEVVSYDCIKHRAQLSKLDRLLWVVRLGNGFHDCLKNASSKVFLGSLLLLGRFL